MPWALPAAGKRVEYHPDVAAFIFSLTHKVKLEQYAEHGSAVSHWNAEWMFGFGGGDFFIHDSCNFMRESDSDLGFTYKPPNKWKYQSSESRSYLGG